MSDPLDNELEMFSPTADAIDWLCEDIHNYAKSKGFYEEGKERNLGEQMLLIVTEISEGFEGVRVGKGHLPDEHCPEFTNFEIELADACLRIFDLAKYKNCRLGQAIVAKNTYNKTRPHKHGKRF